MGSYKYLHLFENNSFSVRSSSEGVSLPPGSKMGLLIILVAPSLRLMMLTHFTSRTDSLRLSHVS